MQASRSQGFFPWKIFSRILLVQSLILLLALASAGLVARHFFKQRFVAQTEAQLKDSLTTLARELTKVNLSEWCNATAEDTSLRFTVIRTDGQVICDSHADTRTMENHANRPEVIAALRDGSGSDVRVSASAAIPMIYQAITVRGQAGLILRGALPLSHLHSTLRVFDASLFAALALVALALAGFGGLLARRLVIPIGRLRGMLSRANTGEANLKPWGEYSELEDSIDTMLEEQATLMSGISDAILAVDRDGSTLFYNSRFALLFGSAEMTARKKLGDFFTQTEILAGFDSALKEGKPATVRAHRFERAYFSVSISPLRKGGEVYGAVGIFHDVTELKLAEQIRIDFVANVSHELRTPLTSIKGYTETLTQDLRDGRPIEKEFVEIISRNTDRLMSLIQDLLDLSSLENNDAHAIGMQKTVVDTADFTTRIVHQLRGVFELKNQIVTLDSLSPTVSADPKRLEQVMVNLLDNANKYTPQGGKISVRWLKPDADGNVVLAISDTGPGIPPEHHARLFERFYRVDKARSREMGGTGLGLAIVKHIMQRHDGSVWVESAPGQGTTFYCQFPR